MNVREFSFSAFGTHIQCWHVSPENIKGVVVLVHGFGEHSHRYLHDVVPKLLGVRLAVVMYDNIGHGRSGGKRGHCPSYDALLDILQLVIQNALLRYPDLPLFLYGHSMGGNLVLNYALRHQEKIRGIIATSPYLRLAFQPPGWKMALARIMLRWFPSFTLPSGLDPNGLSRIPQEVEKYKNDPLVHDKVSPMYSLPIIEAGQWAIENTSNIPVNTILFHGTEDPIIDYKGTMAFHNNSEKTTIRLYEGAFHELHHDLCSNDMLQDVHNWLQQQL